MKSQHLQDSTFFMLTPGVRDRLMEINLTAAEWRMWCYLVSLDPFGDRGAKFSPAELMLKCQIKKTTYFSAKAKFQKLGLFDFRDGVTKVVNLQTSLVQTASEHSQQEEIIESEISESKSEISESKSEISESKSEISESESEISDNQSLKPKPSNVSKTPQTIQTYSDFKKTLSDERAGKSSFNWKDEIQPSERKSFRGFCRLMGEQLPKPVRLLDSWINANFEELNGLYQERYGKDKSSAAPVIQKNTEQLQTSKQELCPAIESALSNGTIIDIYYSSIHNCECVVTKRRETIPVTEWLEGNEYAKLPY